MTAPDRDVPPKSHRHHQQQRRPGIRPEGIASRSDGLSMAIWSLEESRFGYVSKDDPKKQVWRPSLFAVLINFGYETYLEVKQGLDISVCFVHSIQRVSP
jgi:hypothetical protein